MKRVLIVLVLSVGEATPNPNLRDDPVTAFSDSAYEAERNVTQGSLTLETPYA